jgi:Family of unknown function (DUF5681)
MNTEDKQPNEVCASEKNVGYGAPPESTRFKKGASGNPKGRPKGSLNIATVFTKTLREKVVINERGKRRTVTKLEAALKQLVNKAASGDLRALAQLVVLAQDAETKQNVAGPQKPVISDLDREVMDGILKRFQNPNEPEKEQEESYIGEATNGDTECN